jgi:hypothetical protein
LCDGQFFEFDGFVVRGIIDENVDSAQLASGLSDHGPHAGLVGDVAVKRKGSNAKTGEIDDRLLCLPPGRSERDGDIRAGTSQYERAGASQSTRCSCEQGSFAKQRFGGKIVHATNSTVLGSEEVESGKSMSVRIENGGRNVFLGEAKDTPVAVAAAAALPGIFKQGAAPS